MLLGLSSIVTSRSFEIILLATCLSSFFIERQTSLSTSIRQAKTFLQLIQCHGLKSTCPIVLDFFHQPIFIYVCDRREAGICSRTFFGQPSAASAIKTALRTEGPRRRIEVRYHTSLPIVGSHNQQRRGAKPANISLPSKRRLRNAQRRRFSG